MEEDVPLEIWVDNKIPSTTDHNFHPLMYNRLGWCSDQSSGWIRNKQNVVFIRQRPLRRCCTFIMAGLVELNTEQK
jgi:hypothetical protein